MTLGIDYENMVNDYLYAKNYFSSYDTSYRADTADASAYDKSLFDENKTELQRFLDGDTNYCTDGKDDGHIGFFNAAANVVQGALKGAVKTVTGLFTDSDGHFSLGKTLLTVAGGAALVIAAPYFPAVIAGLGAIGVGSGLFKMGKGVVKAFSSKTDAEAKQNWEAVGDGGLTAVASAYGVKAGIKGIKATSTSTKGLSSLDDSATALDKIKALGSDALSSTKNGYARFKADAASAFNTAKEVASYRKAQRDLNKYKNGTYKGDKTEQELLQEVNSKRAYGSDEAKQYMDKLDDISNARKNYNKAKSNYQQTYKKQLEQAQKSLEAAKKSQNENAINAANKYLETVKNGQTDELKALAQTRDNLAKQLPLGQVKTKLQGTNTGNQIANRVKFADGQGKWQTIKTNIANIAKDGIREDFKVIYEFMKSPNTTYAQALQKFGYQNVMEFMGKMGAMAKLYTTQY